jgi:hypothetical protein
MLVSRRGARQSFPGNVRQPWGTPVVTDGSKLANDKVDLIWKPSELYTLLFSRLAREEKSAEAFADLKQRLFGAKYSDNDESHRAMVEAIAGEFMGSSLKRGRVYTWLPLHLSDACGETSPRTFLTAWREAALHAPPPPKRALDHLGIQRGVSKASEDRRIQLRAITDAAHVRIGGEPGSLDADAKVGGVDSTTTRGERCAERSDEIGADGGVLGRTTSHRPDAPVEELMANDAIVLDAEVVFEGESVVCERDHDVRALIARPRTRCSKPALLEENPAYAQQSAGPNSGQTHCRGASASFPSRGPDQTICITHLSERQESPCAWPPDWNQ